MVPMVKKDSKVLWAPEVFLILIVKFFNILFKLQIFKELREKMAWKVILVKKEIKVSLFGITFILNVFFTRCYYPS